MANHGCALGATRPVATGAIVTGGKSATFRGRAGQDVVTVGCKAHARNDLAPFGQRRVHAKLVVVAVQIVDCLSEDFALEILPRSVANAVTRIDGRLSVGSLGAQIGAPGFSARPMPMTKNVMFGACGSCGAACCAGCCCASTPDVTPSDASASAAMMNVFVLFMAVLSIGIFRSDALKS